jgi:Flp pilus assembly protein TadD
MPERKKQKLELIDYVCAAENNPKDIKTRMHLVGAYQQHGHPDKALRELDAMARDFPGEPFVLIARANICLRNKIWKEAIYAYRAVIAAEAATHEVYHNLGIACRGAGLADEAQDAFAAAISMKPDNPAYWLSLAAEHFVAGRFDEVVALLETARGRFADETPLLYLLAASCGKIGDYFKAMIFIEEGLKHAPAEKGFLALKAEILLQTNRFKEAIAEYDNLIEKFGEESLFLCNRGLARETLGEREAALRDYNRAVELDPSNFIALTNRGMLLAGSGAIGKAITDFEAAIEEQPENPVLLHNLAVACLKRGDLYKAADALKKACALKHQPSCDLLKKMYRQ